MRVVINLFQELWLDFRLFNFLVLHNFVFLRFVYLQRAHVSSNFCVLTEPAKQRPNCNFEIRKCLF